MPISKSLKEKMGKSNAIKPIKEPLWKGPEDSGPMGGITQSMLSRYPACHERFRVRYVEGWGTPPKFEKTLEYGHMWHTCEEALAAKVDWQKPLLEYCRKLVVKYKIQQDEVKYWYNTCKTQFPIYVDYWKKQKDVVERTPLLQEYVFHVPYKLPSSRVVYLRGKFDSVDLIGKGKSAGIFLQENKSKGDIDQYNIPRQLTFDLQTMMYLCALESIKGVAHNRDKNFNYPIAGIRYNVVKRPFSGGVGSIRKHKEKNTKKGHTPEETDEEFFGRLGSIMKETPDQWFMRWKVDVNQSHIDNFKKKFLDPCLEELCNNYDWWVQCLRNVHSTFDSEQRKLPEVFGQRACYHYILPFGTYNPLTDGKGVTDLDEYLMTGSTVGLVRQTSLFGELET